MREKFQARQTDIVFRKKNTVLKATKFYKNKSTFVSSIYNFSLAGKQKFLHAKSW